MGFFKSISNAFSNPVRAIEAVGTFGTSEIARSALGGIDPLSIAAPVGLGFLTGNPMMGANLGASIYSGQMGARSQADANAMNMALAQQQMLFSAQQAQQQMAFQQNMSDTAISRAKADMIKAGINPMLAPGSQLSTPSGAMGSYNPAHVDPVPAVAMTAMNSAVSAYKDFATARAANAAADLSHKEAGIKEQQTPGYQFEGTIFRGLNKLLGAFSTDAKNVSKKGIIKGLDTTGRDMSIRNAQSRLNMSGLPSMSF